MVSAISDIIKKLESLILEEEKNTEVESGKILASYKGSSILLPLDQGITYSKTEFINRNGRSDIILIGEELTTSGETKNVAYIWELKAPQLHVFETDNKNRAKPTGELYSAQNQLIHYHSFIRQSGADLKLFKLNDPDDMRIGGIIIGRFNTFVKDNHFLGSTDSKKFAQETQEVWEKYFYKPNHMKLFTWDNVLTNLKSFQASHENKEGDSSVIYNSSEGPAVSATSE